MEKSTKKNLDLRYVCGECLCKICVYKGNSCYPCKTCNNTPKSKCGMSRRFDPNLTKTAKILAKKADCLNIKNGTGLCDVSQCSTCELFVTDEELLEALDTSHTLINNVHHYVVVERFEKKLIYDTTVSNEEYLDKGDGIE